MSADIFVGLELIQEKLDQIVSTYLGFCVIMLGQRLFICDNRCHEVVVVYLRTDINNLFEIVVSFGTFESSSDVFLIELRVVGISQTLVWPGALSLFKSDVFCRVHLNDFFNTSLCLFTLELMQSLCVDIFSLKLV